MWQTDDFRNSKAEVMKVLNRQLEKGNELHDEVTTISQSYGIPIIVVLEFVVEDMPEHTDSCEERIKMLKEFYGIRS